MKRPRPSDLSLALLALLPSLVHCSVLLTREEKDDEASARYMFKTEPAYVPTYFTVDELTNDTSLLAPGYVFIDPVHGAPKIGIGGTTSGPQIREQDGTLIWYGGEYDAFGADAEDPTVHGPERGRVQDFHVCDYKGTTGTHLCWSQHVVGRRRVKVVVDQGYELTQTLMTSYHYDNGKVEPSNMHEFNMVDGGFNYLQPAWPDREMDLTPIGGPKDGHIWDGCFQDVKVATGRVNFDWCWLDHFPMWETNLFPTSGPNITGNITSPKVGNGTANDPFDAWHVNSLDKNSEGDYLLSARHDDQIVKIAGRQNAHGVEPGTILWRVGGRGANVRLESDDFLFSKQHGVRYVDTTPTETIFSILDNAWEGVLQPSADFSSGMIIAVNNETMTARLVHRYPNPKGAIAPSQGSFQVLPNGNTFVGWGSRSQFSEFSQDGQLLLHAGYTNETSDDEEYYTYSYRIFKSPWVGKPGWKPKLIAYSKTCNTSNPLMAWVSWNGATEVRKWEFHVANDELGPWFYAATVSRTGFETEVNLSNTTMAGALQQISFPSWVSVTALDANDDKLDYGVQIVETFVPKPNIRNKFCTDDGCFGRKGFDYDRNLSCVGTCGRSLLPQFVIFVFIVVVIEMGMTAYQRLCANWTRTRSGWAYGGPSDAEYASLPGMNGHAKFSKSPMPIYREGQAIGGKSRSAQPDISTNGYLDALTPRPGYQRAVTPAYNLMSPVE